MPMSVFDFFLSLACKVPYGIKIMVHDHLAEAQQFRIVVTGEINNEIRTHVKFAMVDKILKRPEFVKNLLPVALEQAGHRIRGDEKWSAFDVIFLEKFRGIV